MTNSTRYPRALPRPGVGTVVQTCSAGQPDDVSLTRWGRASAS
jgi:hypothetical protein